MIKSTTLIIINILLILVPGYWIYKDFSKKGKLKKYKASSEKELKNLLKPTFN